MIRFYIGFNRFVLEGVVGLHKVLYGLYRFIRVSEKVPGCLPVASY